MFYEGSLQDGVATQERLCWISIPLAGDAWHRLMLFMHGLKCRRDP